MKREIKGYDYLFYQQLLADILQNLRQEIISAAGDYQQSNRLLISQLDFELSKE